MSNTGQSTDGYTACVSGSQSLDCAQGFTAGPHLKYALNAITLDMQQAPGSGITLTVTVRGDNGSGHPSNTVKYLLTNPNLGTAGIKRFDAPFGARLDANSQYFVHVAYSGNGTIPRWNLTTNNAEDSGAATGWSIRDHRHTRQSGATGAWQGGGGTYSTSMQIGVFGYALVPPAPTNLNAAPGDGEVVLTWDDPNNSVISKYQYRKKAGSGSYGNWSNITGSGATTTTYTATGLTNGTQYTFAVRAVSSAGNGFESTVTAEPLAVPPTVTGLATVDYAENGTAAIETYTIADPDASGTVSVLDLSGDDASQFSLTTTDNADGTVTAELNFIDAPDYEAPIDSGGNNVYEVTLSGSDGSNTTDLDITVTVTGVNDNNPTVTGLATVNYAENGTAAIETYTITDADAGDTVSVLNLTGIDVSRFSLPNTGGGTATVTAELNFTTAPNYEVPTDSDDNNDYEVTLNFSDGSRTTALAITVTVTDVDDVSVWSGTTTGAVTEDDSAANSATGTLTITDEDENDTDPTITAQTDTNGTYGSFSIADDGVWTYTLDNTDADTNALDDGEDVTDTFPVTASDSNTQNVVITISGDDDPPVITGPAPPVTFAENGTNAIATYSATDPEGHSITWGVSSFNIPGTEDWNSFSVSTLSNGDGELKFNPPPNYEAPTDHNSDNVYGALLYAATPSGNNGALLVAVTVTDLPAVSGLATVDYAENGTAAVGTYTATDADGQAVSVTWSLEGDDSGDFTISGGALSFASPPDHETATDADTDNVYEVTVVATDGSEAGRLDVSVAVTGVDEAPTADAGADQTVADGTEVTLDGSGSADVDGDTLTYLWAQTAPDSGADVTLSSTAAEQPTFTAPERETDVTLTFELKVSDDGGATYSAATDTVDVTVTAQDDAPTADAGADQTVADGTEVTLDGSGSADVDGDTLTYLWAQTAPDSGADVTLSSTAAEQPTFTAPERETDVTLTFELKVSDDGGATYSAATDTVDVTVTAQDDAPTAHAGADQTVADGTEVTLDGSGSADVDGDTLTYLWAQTAPDSGADVTLSSTAAEQPTFTAPERETDVTLTFELKVSDDGGATYSAATDTVDVTVTAQDDAPTAHAGADQTVADGTEVTLDGSGSADVDGDTLTYLWAQTAPDAGADVTLSSTAAEQPTFTAPERETDVTLTFELKVSDDGGATYSAATDTVDVTVTAQDDAPTAHAGADQTVADGTEVTLDGSGSADVDGDTLTYLWAQTAPDSGADVTLSSTAAEQPTFTAPERETDVTLTFELKVSDDGGATYSAATDTVDVTVTAQDDAPTAHAGADQTVADGTEVTLDGSGSADVDGDTLTYLWAQTAPDSGADVTLSSTAAEQPTFTAPERETDVTLTFELKVSDDGGATYSAATDTVDVTVTAQDDAPTAHAGADQTVAEAATVTLDGSGSSDPEGAAGLTYSWSQTAPASGEGSGVELSDTAAQSPTFTAPTQLSNDVTLTFSLTVNDGTNTSTAATVDVTVIAVPAAPMNLSATPGDAQVTLTWDDPGDDTITKYQVSTDGGTSFSDIDGSGQNTTAHTVTELTNGTAHTLAVRAVNASGNGDASTVTVTMVPAAPTNLSKTPGDGRATLSWTDPGNTTITGYQVSSDGGTSFADIAGSGASTTTHTVTGLTNGTDYTLAVRAANASGDGAVATVGATPVAVPAVPSGLNAAVTGDSQVALTWDNPGNTTITGYELRVDNGAWAAIADSDADTTSHTVTGLNDGATYNFHVRAVNDSGPGVSAYVDASIPHSFEVPAAPSGLAAVAGDGQVALTWDTPSDDNIWRWEYRQRKGTLEYGNWTAIDGSSASTTGHTVTDLTNGTEYSFALRAVNGSGNGSASTVTVTMVPAAPTNLSAAPGDAQATLSWTDPGNATITGYELRVDSGAWADIAGSDADTASHTVTGLTNGTEYGFALRAANGSGDGAVSSIAATPRAAVAGVPAAPVGLSATPGDAQVTLSWTDPGDATITGYELRVDSGAWADIAGSDADTASHTVTGLTNGTEYGFALRAANGSGDGAVSSIAATPLAVPAAPLGLAAAAGDAQVALSWTDPGNATITGYELRVDSGAWADIAGSDADTASHTVTGLTNGTEYGFALRAANGSGDGAVSSIAATPRAAVAGVPAAPVGLSATPGDAQVTLSWTDPGDATIDNYQVSSDGGTSFADIAGSGATTTGHIVTGLTNGTAYTLALRAANGSGDGAVSSIAATPRAGNNPPTVAAPLADRTLTEGATLTVDVSAAFDDHDDDDLTYTAVSDTPAALTVAVSQATLTLTGVAAGTATVTVTASDGTDSASDPFAVTVEADTQPSFASDIADRTYTRGAAITTLTLPLASGGNGALSYSLTPAPPAGLVFDPVARTLSGTPTAAQAATAYAYTAVDADEDAAGQSFTIEIRESALATQPPLAPANFAATAGDARVTLTWDTAGDDSITGWQYWQKAGAGAYGDWTAIGGSHAGTTAHAVAPLVNGTAYAFRVRAANAAGDGAPSQEASATPRAGNNPPTVAAPLADRSLTVGATLTVDVSATFDDHDGDDLTYAAVSDTPAALTVAVSQATLTLTGVAAGTATVTVTASDGEDSASDPFAATVEADTQPSFASDIADRTYTRGAAITTLTLPLASGGNGALSYSLTPAPPAGLVFDPVARTLSGTPTAAQAATAYAYTAVDADGDVASRGFSIAVTATTPAAPANFAATAGDARVTLTWDTAGDDSITGWQYWQKAGAGAYGDWTAIGGSGAGTTAHAVAPLVNGTAYAFRVRAANAAGDGAPSQEASATARAGNNPPTVAAPLADRSLTVGATLTVDVSATFDDHDGDDLTYAAVSDTPAALTVAVSQATLTLTGVAAGTATVTVTASDGEDSASDPFAATVEADTQPSFASDIADRTYTRGAAITTLTLPLASGGNGALSYSLTPAPPAGLVFDPVARTLSGTPTAAQAATAYAYTAVDADGDVASRGFSIAVTATTPAAPANFAATAGDARVTLTWDTAGDDSILRWEYRQRQGAGAYGDWTAIGGSGAGTTAHAVAPLVNGTAYAFRVRAANAAGDGAPSQEASATPRAGNNPPTVAAPLADRSLTVGATLTVDVSATFDDHDGDDLTYAAVSDTPAALTVAVSQATLTLTGVAAGTAAVTVTASDGEDSASDAFAATVEADTQPSFASGIADRTYTRGVEIAPLTLPLASGGNGALAYSLTPAPSAGLVFDPDARTLSGTPTAAQAATAYTYTAEDADGDVASRGFSIVVTAENIPLTVVSFQDSTYTATEAGMAATITVNLSQARNEELAIPIRMTRPETTEVGDYTVEGLEDWDAHAGTGTLTFSANATQQTWSIAANHDGDGDDETLEVGFGELSELVVAGEPAAATVMLKDKGLVALKMSFGQAKYTVLEGQQADIEMMMSPAADRRVEVPLAIAPSGGATEQDYGAMPASVVFEEGESQRTISVAATMDEVNDPGEGIVLSPDGLPEMVSTGDPASTQVHFMQRRSEEQFSQTQEAMLAVVARSMAESAQTAIARRFERHRQGSHLESSGGTGSTPSPAHDDRTTTSSRGESVWIDSEGAGGEAAEGSLVHNAWGAAKTNAATESHWNSDNPETGAPGSWLPSFSLGSSGNLGRSDRNHLGAAPGAGMELGGGVYGQDRLYGSGVAGAPLGAGSGDFSGMRAQDPSLSGVSFEMGLGEREQETSWVPVLWGQGDLQHFNGDLTRLGMDYRGGLDAAHIGLDLYANERMLAGLSFMRSWGDMDYTDDGIDGVLESRMDTVHPYLYWQPNARVGVWGIGGLGGGEVDVEEPGRTHDFDADFRMFAGGLRAVLSRRGSNEWGLRADAFTAQLQTDALEDIAKVSGQAHRGRLMLEWVHERSLSAGRSLSLKAEVGGRFDGGDADRGSGVETGFRLGYLDTNRGLDVALHGRVLVVHESEYRDWGAGVQASWDPGEKQRGFRASVMSSWGQDGGGRTTLWDNAEAVTRPAGTGARGLGSAHQMQSEVAYAGMKAPRLPGLLTPYSRVRWAGQAREAALGASWNPAESRRSALPLTIELEALRRENRTDPSHHELLLRVSIPLGGSTGVMPTADGTRQEATFVGQGTPRGAAESHADNVRATAAAPELPAAPASARQPDTKLPPEPVATEQALPASQPSSASVWPQDGSPQAKPTTPLPGSTVAPGRGIVVQLGAFRSYEKSARFTDQLRQAGYAARTVHGSDYNRVVVGPFPTLIDAAAAQLQLDRQGHRGYVRPDPGVLDRR